MHKFIAINKYSRKNLIRCALGASTNNQANMLSNIFIFLLVAKKILSQD